MHILKKEGRDLLTAGVMETHVLERHREACVR